jgi:hypothetical protein
LQPHAILAPPPPAPPQTPTDPRPPPPPHTHPPGRYLEIFARKNNLRNFWVSLGNEVTGTGLPAEDVEAFRQRQCIPGAVYGRAAAAGSAGGGGAGAGGAAAS